MPLTFFLSDLPPDIHEPSLLKRLGNGLVVAPTGAVATVGARTAREAEHAAVAFGQSKLVAETPVTTGETPQDQQLGLQCASSEENAQHAGGTGWAHSRRVLIVDDDRVCLQGIQDLLALHLSQVCVDLADSGDVAMKLARTHEFDAVLSDVQMPGLDGFALIEKLKEIKPQTPVVLMTGSPDLMPRMVESGAFGFIRKPVDRKQCVTTLQHALMYCALCKLSGHAKEHTNESFLVQAGLRWLAETEIGESTKRWNSD